MSYGKSYSLSWWGDVNAANGWGSIYPFDADGSLVSLDSNQYTTDTTLLTTDNSDGFAAASGATFDCSTANFAVANGTTGATVSGTVSAGTLNSVSPTTYQSGSSTYTANITIPGGYSNSGIISTCTDTAIGAGTGSSPGSIVSTQYSLLISYGGVNISFVYNGLTYIKGLTDTLSDITNLNGGSSSYGTNTIRFDTASPDVGSYMTDGFGTFINSNNTHLGFAPYAAFATPKFMTVKLNIINPFPPALNVYPIYKIEQANGFIQITQKITS